MSTAMLGAIAALIALAAATGVVWVIRRRNLHLWLPAYLARRSVRPERRPVHVLFCFVDHFEPAWGKADVATQTERVARWCHDYRSLAARHRDADGRPPQHTFFYPEEEYLETHLAQLSELCAEGYGEIEVHLHHDDDNEANFRRTVSAFVETLHQRHGALSRDTETGAIRFGFIHGNWALDNSRADGRWCGINNEIALLSELGCYADFTLPSAPSDTQTRTVNSIYYASDDPLRPRSHDFGVPVRVGGRASGDLMIVQGPLALDWQDRSRGLFPRIENADVRKTRPPTPGRVDLWVRTGIHVLGRPEWVVVKVHTHGTQERDIETLLGAEADAMHSYLESRYNDGSEYVLHYVTARELYNIVKAAEAGRDGDPGRYRDFVLPPPPHRVRS
jgi:hypothetical protein